MNPLGRTTSGLLLLVLWFGLPAAGRTESWPTFDSYVRSSTLIVKAKHVGVRDGKLAFAVVDSLKGWYDTRMFLETSREAYFYALDREHGVIDVVPGQEIIFFFSPHNQPVAGKIHRHSTAMPVRNGRVVYAATSDWLRKEFTLAAFERQIVRLVALQQQEAGEVLVCLPPKRNRLALLGLTPKQDSH